MVNPSGKSGIRDTTHDHDSFVETLVALAEAIHALTVPDTMLIAATVDQLIEALRIDYENGGFFDIGTFACGVCLANGTTYTPWNDEALQWLRDNVDAIQLAEFVGKRDDKVNLCPPCAAEISRQIWENTDTRLSVEPRFDMFANGLPTQPRDVPATDSDA